MHPRYAPFLFALLLSGVMTLLVSGVATVRGVGLVPELAQLWMSSWVVSWAIAFPLVFVLAPLVRRLVASITRAPS